LAALLDSDENFMLYRRFGFLQARILLNKQDELRDLEKKLDRMDLADQKNNSSILRSREKDVATSDHRKNLLHEVEDTFKEYGEFTSKFQIGTANSRYSSTPERCARSCKF